MAAKDAGKRSFPGRAGGLINKRKTNIPYQKGSLRVNGTRVLEGERGPRSSKDLASRRNRGTEIGWQVLRGTGILVSAKLTRAERRAEQAEAQLKHMQTNAVLVAPESMAAVSIEKEQSAPTNLACPGGTKLQARRVIDLAKNGDAQSTDWERVLA